MILGFDPQASNTEPTEARTSQVEEVWTLLVGKQSGQIAAVWEPTESGHVFRVPLGRFILEHWVLDRWPFRGRAMRHNSARHCLS